MYLCTWHDDDGQHYGLTKASPRKFFSWPCCYLCDPKVCTISAEDACNGFDVSAEDMIRLLDNEFVEIDLNSSESWEMYLNLRKKMEYLFF